MKGYDYHCIISLISKNEAIKLLQNADWLKKVEHYKSKIKTYLKVYIKIEKTIIKFGDIEVLKQKFDQHKVAISIKNIDIDNIIVPNKVTFGKKGFRYFIYFSQK